MMRLAVLLTVALAFAARSADAIDAGDGLTGAEVAELVSNAMLSAGLHGAPRVSALRPYPACTTELSIEPQDAAWGTIQLTCTEPQWQRRLRTGTASPVHQPQSGEGQIPGEMVVVLTESLARGTIIQPSHLELHPRSSVHLQGTFDTPSNIVGRRLVVNLGAGRPVLARHLEYDWVVTEGSAIMISASQRGVTVMTGGIALESGQAGERIEVRNERSGRILEGIVASETQVVVFPNMN